MNMKEQKFALEIRITGITRKKVAQILSEQFNTNFLYEGGSGFIYSFNDNLNRKWRIVKDDSIKEQTVNSPANQNYRVKIITPILNYNDIRTIEEAVSNLKSNGAIINDSCKTDIYVDSIPYKTTNLASIHKLMFSKEDMLCRALDIETLDENKLSVEVDSEKIKNIMFHKPSSDYELNQKWYTNYDGYLNKIDEQKIRANSTDLVSFLQSQGEALERSGKEWRWKSHSGVVVFENKWYSHYENKGGLAIDFIQNFYNVSFPEAVSMLLNGETGVEMSQSELNKMNTDSKPSKQFKLPEANSDMKRVYAYLMKQRFIDRNVIDYFVQNKMIYEDKKYHNIVFVGYDENGVAKHAYKRGTYTHAGSYKGNEAGSNPDYSFHHIGGGNDLYVFESAIDMLSFITLNQRQWKEKNYVALDGIAEHAMIHILSKNRNINRVILCLDNDIAGIEATGRLKGILKLNDYNNVSKIIPFNKDFNEDLKAFHGIEAIPAKEHPQVQLFKKVCNDIKLLHKDEYMKSCCDTSIKWFDKVAECYILARHNSTDEQIKNGKEKEVLELMKKAAVYLIINESKYLNGTNILPDCSNEDLRDRILRKLCKNYYPCSSNEKLGLSKLEKILSEIMRKDDEETVQTITNKLEILKLHNHAIGECIKSSIFIEQQYLQALAHENKDIETQIAIGI